MNYIAKHKDCTHGHAWHENGNTAYAGRLQEAVRQVSKVLDDKEPLLTFNTDWNKLNDENQECSNCGATIKYHRELGGCAQP